MGPPGPTTIGNLADYRAAYNNLGPYDGNNIRTFHTPAPDAMLSVPNLTTGRWIFDLEVFIPPGAADIYGQVQMHGLDCWSMAVSYECVRGMAGAGVRAFSQYLSGQAFNFTFGDNFGTTQAGFFRARGYIDIKSLFDGAVPFPPGPNSLYFTWGRFQNSGNPVTIFGGTLQAYKINTYG
jgi:hypothetical protein